MNELATIELHLLLEGIWRYYGHDFRDYIPNYIEGQIVKHLQSEGIKTISALQERILHDKEAMTRLLNVLSNCHTGFFREPLFFRFFRDKLIPLWRSVPAIRLWQAGCSTGEEVYSLAILLQEEGLYDRSLIYATDINETALQQGKAGSYSMVSMAGNGQNYLAAGGKGQLSDYYEIQGDRLIFDPALRSRVLFAQHNLIIDQSFQEFHSIICQNVLIYFNQSLQTRVHRLFYESLELFGYLGLGNTETIQFTPYEPCYRALDTEIKWYQKVA